MRIESDYQTGIDVDDLIDQRKVEIDKHHVTCVPFFEDHIAIMGDSNS